MNQAPLSREQVCEEILLSCRSQVCLHLRQFDLGMSRFSYRENDAVPTLATDGKTLFYNPEYLLKQYRTTPIPLQRGYVHLLLHCLFDHLFSRRDREESYWNLACDITVESMIDSINLACLRRPQSWLRQETYQFFRQKLPVLTPQGIYRLFAGLGLEEKRYRQLVQEFFVDDHCYWPDPNQNLPAMEQLRQQWRQISQQTQSQMEQLQEQTKDQSGDLLEQLSVAHRRRYDYRAFLKRFCVFQEQMQLDPDGFDYGYYTLGLQLYGNVPLIEPPETKEVKRVHDLVIAIDTSLSCSGELVHAFLEQTYAILKEEDSYFHQVNIHILQCDEAVRQHRAVHSAAQLEEYMAHFTLQGGGGTDFRPVFSYVEQLRGQGELSRLKGLIYFTDGQGTFPTRPTDYETAFVFLRQPGQPDPEVPPWAMKLMIEPEQLLDSQKGETAP